MTEGLPYTCVLNILEPHLLWRFAVKRVGHLLNNYAMNGRNVRTINIRKIAIVCAFLLTSIILTYLHEYPILIVVVGTMAFYLAVHDRKRPMLRVILVFMITLFALNPSPVHFAEQVVRERDPRVLVQPNNGLITGISSRANPSSLGLDGFEAFIYQLLPYRYDYFIWLTADYWPTAEEAISMGFEDCDGRAIVACSILRSLGYEAYVLIGLDHAWVEVMIDGNPKQILWPRPPEIMRFDERTLKWVGVPEEIKLRLFPPIFYIDIYVAMALTLWLSFCQLMTADGIRSGFVKALENLPFNVLLSYIAMIWPIALSYIVPAVLALLIPLAIRLNPLEILRVWVSSRLK